MKQTTPPVLLGCLSPAAFRRLCVETADVMVDDLPPIPAAFRRLCVETYRLDR